MTLTERKEEGKKDKGRGRKGGEGMEGHISLAVRHWEPGDIQQGEDLSQE